VSNRDGQKGLPIVALGLSAIDMLCCAMVSALVMFLVLSSPRPPRPVDGGRKGDLSGIHLRYEPENPDTIVVLRFVRRGHLDQHVDFYSYQAERLHFITDETLRDRLVDPDGTIQEHTQQVRSPESNTGRDEFFYNITQLRPVRWNIMLTYADTRHQLGSQIPANAKLKVDFTGDACSLSLQCSVKLGESVSLEAHECVQTTDKSCNVALVLDGLAQRVPKTK
jgi:hypothetical protein